MNVVAVVLVVLSLCYLEKTWCPIILPGFGQLSATRWFDLKAGLFFQLYKLV